MRDNITPKIQQEEIEHVCDDCYRGYYTEQGLERHVERVHGQ